RLELAVLGPGDICSEASVLGEERQPHSCVVASSTGLVTLSLSAWDLRKLVHPADLQTLREHFAQRYNERSNRLAVATNLANMSAVDLGRIQGEEGGSQQAPAGGGIEGTAAFGGGYDAGGALSARKRSSGSGAAAGGGSSTRSGSSGSGISSNVG
ncbi:hypothetical protein Agub_g6193, partial [Astrephomene gubernaculifera]